MLEVLLISVEPIHVVHGYDFLAVRLGVALEEVESMDKLVDVLEAAVHAESARWSVSVSCVAGQEDVLVRHFICQLGLQLPPPDVDYLQVALGL